MDAMDIFVLVLVLISWSQKCSSRCSSHYGAEPCKFVPAAPGRTPSCARPGLTYCEQPSYYPGPLIQHLIDQWQYDYMSIFNSETPDDFNSYYVPTPKHGLRPVYGPPNILHQDQQQPEPIYIPKPIFPAVNHQPENVYIPPPLPAEQNHSLITYVDGRPYYQHQLELPYNYKTTFKPESNYDQQTQFYNHLPDLTQANSWWKRRARDLDRHKRASVFYTLVGDVVMTKQTSTAHHREKRQNPLTGEQLCQTRSQYIMPRAALNSKGNWMYVINMPEVDSKYTQLVKSEICLSQQCSGLCGLPSGYTSRCEQKYVQKRLVALEGSGNQLYTDVFWFPSCCVCTISK